MIKPIDELMQSVRGVIGEDTSDEAIALIEDINDTVTDLKTKAEDTTNWEQRAKEIDEKWRQKYKDRFFNSETEGDEPDESESEEPAHLVRFEDLFKEG